ncbi:hypothetical protein KEG38_19765 [Polyangium jinanense]|uniref:hypothetical protein n=1 Tax=Polyangium jinanense TaxID=2829994 RepID=UPI002341DE7B|nr:hypothetical protein [Polyangium jinanense]MDC3956109.1 hypothetical protein [Polyangium jinanense]
MRKAPLSLSSVLVLALAVGCGGEQNSPANSGWSQDLGDPTGQPLRRTETLSELDQPPAPLTGTTTTPPTEKRVRHDVMIAKDAPHAATCSCLAVVVGAPQDPRLTWQAQVPKLGGDVAVVAVSAKGVPCPGMAEDAPQRPSIAAVEQEGADVVLTIEELSPGRPQASGAVVPRPGPGGAVYVKPKGPKVPYGRPAAGAGARCKVQ